MIHEYLKSIKSGQVSLLHTPLGWVLIADIRQATALAKLKNLKLATDSNPYTIALGEIGLIASYASDLPDVYYDFVEFEENPLTVFVEKTIFDTAYSPIALSFIKEGFLKDILLKIGRPLLSINLETHQYDKISDKILNEVEIIQKKPDPNTKIKIQKLIYLGNDGEIKFLN